MPDESPRWYLRFGEDKEGPLTTDDIWFLLARKRVDGSTFAWHRGMESWTRIRDLDEFQPKPSKAAAKSASATPNSASAAATQTAEAASTAASRRFGRKLLALILALALLSGGIYWGALRGDDDDAGAEPAAKKASRLVEKLIGKENPKAESALVQMGGPAVPVLLQVLAPDAPEVPPERIRRVLLAMGPAAIGPMATTLRGGEAPAGLRIFIIQVLGDIGESPVVPVLIAALNDPEGPVQSEAVKALGGLGQQIGPALLNRLTSPIHDAGPQARRNLAKALEPHAKPAMTPGLQQAAAIERDPEVRKKLNQILEAVSGGRADASRPSAPQPAGPSSNPSAPPPAAPAAAQQMPAAAPPPPSPINVNVQASAEAKASTPGPPESDPDPADPTAAQAHADSAGKHLEKGDKEKALDEYKKAYALNAIPAYYLIILELESEAAEAPKGAPAPPHEVIPEPVSVTLEELHTALTDHNSDIGKYNDAVGIWRGRLPHLSPLAQERGREQYLVRGEAEGLDFVASLPAGMSRSKGLQPDSSRVWKGRLEGFKVVRQNSGSQVLPVLLVDNLE